MATATQSAVRARRFHIGGLIVLAAFTGTYNGLMFKDQSLTTGLINTGIIALLMGGAILAAKRAKDPRDKLGLVTAGVFFSFLLTMTASIAGLGEAVTSFGIIYGFCAVVMIAAWPFIRRADVKDKLTKRRRELFIQTLENAPRTDRVATSHDFDVFTLDGLADQAITVAAGRAINPEQDFRGTEARTVGNYLWGQVLQELPDPAKRPSRFKNRTIREA
jgi:hypothetical protein